jgi:hypothetical protein
VLLLLPATLLLLLLPLPARWAVAAALQQQLVAR